MSSNSTMEANLNRPTRGRPLRRRVAVMLVAGALAALGGLAAAQSAAGISVGGFGVAYGEPDQAVLTVGVAVSEPAVRAALDSADQLMGSVRSTLVNNGVAELDIRTVSFNVWRQDIYDEQGNPHGERYHVDHQYEVVVRDVTKVAELLSATVEAGANSVGGITFTIADLSALQATARAAAMQDAKDRAEQLAALAGVKLGAPLAISEGSAYGAAPMFDMRYNAAMSGGGAVADGQLAIQVTVAITYGLVGAH